MIANRSLALAPFVLLAASPAWSGAAANRPNAVACDREQEPPQSPKIVERLSESEVAGLIGEVKEEAPLRGMEVRGRIAIRSAFLSEIEAKGLLAAFLKKNGFAAAAGKLGDIEMDAVDPARRVGIKIAKEGTTDLDEIALLKARGEARVLVLDARNFEYDGQGFFADRLPTKRGAAYALLAELERFLNE